MVKLTRLNLLELTQYSQDNDTVRLLEMPMRLINLLLRMDYHEINEIVYVLNSKNGDGRLMAFHGFGNKSLDDLKQALKQAGYNLNEN